MQNTSHNNLSKFNFPRELNTLILFLTAICNSMIVQALSSINKQVVGYLPQVTSTQVSICALLFMIIHPCVSIPANYVLDNYPLKIGISIDCVMVLIGVCLRMLVLEGFGWVIGGNAIVAIGNAFILYCPAKYSAVWYPPENRLLVTGLIVFANTVSGGVGAFISPFFVKQDLDPDVGRLDIRTYMIFQGILVGSIMIINLLFFRGKPKQIQSQQNRKVSREATKKPYKTILKNLFTTKQFLLLFTTVFLSFSILNSLLTNVELIITPFGLTSKDAGLAAIAVLPAALISSIVTSMIIKKTRLYKKCIIIQLISSIVSLGAISFGLFMEIYVFFWIGLIMLGIFGFPMLPNIIQYSCQSLYPIGQATISGLLIAGGQLMSFLVGLLQAYILDNGVKSSVIYIFIIDLSFFGVALIAFWQTTQNLKRFQFQTKKQGAASLFSEGEQFVEDTQ